MKSEQTDRTVVAPSDLAGVKHCLDECVSWHFKDNGFTEDLSVSNWKMVFGYTATAVALLAQFYPKPFAESKELLKWCVIVYFILHAILLGIFYILEEDILLNTSSPDAMELGSCLHRFKPQYNLIIKRKGKPAMNHIFDTTDCFDVNGTFIWERMNAALNKFRNEKNLISTKKDKDQ